MRPCIVQLRILDLRLATIEKNHSIAFIGLDVLKF